MRHSRSLLATLAVTLGAGLGCQFSSQVPSGAVIHCSGNEGACPTGYVCRPALDRCVANSLANGATASVVGLSVSPTIGNASTTFVLAFQVSAPLAEPPSASLALPNSSQSYPFACSPCTADLACQCSFTPTPGNLPPAGTYQTQVQIVDAVGHVPAPSTGPSVQLDYTPPALVPPVTLALSPPAGVTTPLTALGPGVTANLCFTIDEQLAAPPIVWADSVAAPDAGQLPFTLDANYPVGSFYFYCFRVTLPASGGVPDGVLEAWARATDLAGNEATLPLQPASTDGGPQLLADRTPPSPPDLSETNGLRYHRAPWGELPTVGQPHFYLSSPGPAVAKAGTLIAYGDAAGQEELGRWPVIPGAVPELELVPADHPEVWVELIDLAGNPQPGGPEGVSNVDWVLSLGPEGAVPTNPHTCFAKPAIGPTLLQPDDSFTALSPTQAPNGIDGGTVTVVGAASWRQRTQGVPDLSTNTLSYDPAQGLVYIFNGDDQTGVFDGHGWSLPAERSEPSERADFAMTHDRSRGREVLFGGQDQTSTGALLCDTWELGPGGWAQARACPQFPDGGFEPGLPPPRLDPCLAYDSTLQHSLLLSGTDAEGDTFADAWTWDGATWTMLPPADGGPDFSCLRNTLTYVEGSDAGFFVMLESPATSGSNGATTWTGRWDGATYEWTAALPPVSSEMLAQSVTRDPGSGLLIAAFVDLGTDGGGGTVDLLSWDGASSEGWQLIGPTSVDWLSNDYTTNLIMLAPVPGLGQSVVALLDSGDEETDYVYACALQPLSCTLLHGGSTANNDEPAFPYSDVNAVAFDPYGNGLLASVYPVTADGGTPAYLSDSLWFTDSHGNNSEDWTLDVTGPAARDGAALGYLPPADAFLLFGGSFADYSGLPDVDDLWSYVIGRDRWVEVSPSVERPEPDGGVHPGRHGYESLLWIPDAGLEGGMVAVGSGFAPLWILMDGGSTVLYPSSPAGAAAYDPWRHKVVLVDQYSHTVYESTPPSLELTPVYTAPEIPLVPSLVADEPSGSLLVVGGGLATGEAVEGAVERWSGSELVPVPLSDPENDGNPVTDYLPVVAYDPFRQRTTLVLGVGDQSANQAWELTLATNRPGLTCQFQLSAAGIPAGTAFTRLEIDATAGAQVPSSDAGAEAEAVLAVWSAGAWRTVQTCPVSTCPVPTPAALSFQTADPATIQALFADRAILGVAVMPSGANGHGLSEVSVSSMQAELSYRLP